MNATDLIRVIESKYATAVSLILVALLMCIPANVDGQTPTKEYIYSNGHVMAIENSTAGSSQPNHPYGYIELPGPAVNFQPLTGLVVLSGWALSNQSAIDHVAVFIDNVSYGNAVYGNSRTDVCRQNPSAVGCPAANVGWTLAFDTSTLANGTPHNLTITIYDSSTPSQQASLSQSFTVSNAISPGPLQTDQFNASSVNTSLWSLQNAVGDGSTTESNGHLQIVVPAGNSHDPYTSGNNGVELLQTIANSDFQAEAKFDSAPSNSSQGIMALQDNSNFVRCDVISNNGLFGYSAAITSSGVANEVYPAINASSSYWLRLSRQGNNWSCSASTDGTNYTVINQFTQALTLTKLGPWAGNLGQAFTAQVDYFSNSFTTVSTALQTDQFNGSIVNSSLWSLQNAVGDGSTTESNGHLQIVVPGGNSHDPYTSGNNGVELLQTIANSDFQVEAKFDSAPSNSSQGIMALQDNSNFVRCDVISNSGLFAYSSAITSGGVNNEVYPSINSSASYWLRLSRQGNNWSCSASTDGQTYTAINQFTQALTITKLGPWAGNLGQAFTAQVDYFSNGFTTVSNPVQTDQFNASSVNSSLWSLQNTIGDGSVSEVSGHLKIVVPSGSSHDPYTSGNNGVELFQTISNSDFQAEAKFDSKPSNSSQGLMALQDNSNFVRCDIVSNNGLFAYSSAITSGGVNDEVYPSINSSASYWLRLSRQGNAWSCSASTDGTNYTVINQFTQALAVTKLGPWAGNLGTAFTAKVDYFSNAFTTP